ncbi:MAG TPA: sporulation integral membrane protein YtvI [Firmicutes bacterium]|nr:sporulation integral membrane protein YtvI [Bacillota bacterium]
MSFLRELLTPKRVIIFILIAVGLLFFSKQIATALLPFIIGVTFAIILEPVITFLERRVRVPRGPAVFATLIATGAMASYGVFMVVSQLIGELVELASLLPEYRESITNLTTDLLGQFEILNENLPNVMSMNIQTSVQEFLVTLEKGTREFLNRVLATFSSLPTFVLVSVITLVATFFIAKDKDLIINAFMQFVPPGARDQAGKFRETVSVDLFGYIKGRVVMLLISTLVAALGLFLIGTRYWILLAIIIGILDQIPIVGPGVIFTPWVGMSVIAGDVDRAVYLTILYFIIFAFHNFVEPKIMGDSVNLHPLLMLLAIYGGVVFFGVVGIFVGPIIAILIRATTASGLFKWPPYSEK